MTYAVLLERQAEKDLRDLPLPSLKRIDARLLALSDEPRPKGALKLKGKEGEGWRVRIGDYRILYTIDTNQRIVKVYRIGHRRDVYQ